LQIAGRVLASQGSGQRYRYADISLARDLIGYEPRVPIAEAVLRAVVSYLEETRAAGPHSVASPLWQDTPTPG
jgi:nucleoside-diphosphate-sugar epimerase